MKYVLNVLLMLLVFIKAYAQAPQAIPYQAAARNSIGEILVSTPISVRFSVKDSVAAGEIKYSEIHNITTTDKGIFSVNIGQGTPITGTLSEIKWGTNAKYLQVEIDPSGGSSYIDMGTIQMMSVPYSLNSASVKLSFSTNGDSLLSGGGNYLIVPGLSAANLQIGMRYGGGIIAYLLQPGDPGYITGEIHGIIAAPYNIGSGTSWGCTYTSISGTSSISIGSGSTNTNAIIAGCTTAGIAARLCADFVVGEYSDWYLPSKQELQKLYDNRVAIGIPSSSIYWSSSQVSSSIAWVLSFNNGVAYDLFLKSTAVYSVRAIRYF